MDRYIGLNAHASSCTVATVGPSGRRLHSQIVETNAGALIRVLRGIPGTRHLCLEEGTHATWLYEVLSPHVEEIVVAVRSGTTTKGRTAIWRAFNQSPPRGWRVRARPATHGLPDSNP